MSVRVEITPNWVKFHDGEEPPIPWIEDEISEIVIRNPAGRDITFTYPAAQSRKSVREVLPPEGRRDDRSGGSDFHDDNGVYVLPCTD